ncbi:MAG TPA: glycosyltransferase, partial [Flavisolibacter sp.]|nr:glycosyltransferase [Flavisolibacter sp.]
MQRKKILWLVSWYPNRNDRFTGDFIQRHARAAAVYHDIYVLYVVAGQVASEVEHEINVAGGLTEDIIYFKDQPEQLAWKLKKQVIWRKITIEAVLTYIQNNGKPDCVHVHVLWKAGLVAMHFKKNMGLEYLVTEHWNIYNKSTPHNYYTKSSVERFLFRRIYKNANALVSVSQFIANAMQKTFGPKECKMKIPNVVDAKLFFPVGQKGRSFRFIHVSNMVPLKNVGGILLAFEKLVKIKKMENVEIVFVGNKDGEYVKLALELGLLNKNAFFKGEISYEVVATEMKNAHCFILNSMIENSPCVIGEALCCGLPVIATSVGGVPELVDDSNSILISPDNEDNLVAAMERMVKNYGIYN